ncbi:SprT-like domain-containing protein [Akkermansiaceae bacterium]|nr:SprT-like domain-containing protein [Akkermansiaceae bacterium]MDB4500947.1 SprT-like domain-containing protein [Akkermansiaceae bacterium]
MRSDARQMELGFSHEEPLPSPRSLGILEACSHFMGIDEDLTMISSKLAMMLGLEELAQRVGVEWNPRMRSTAGRATWPTCLIELNTHLPQISQDEVRRTLLHELAHLVTYERLGHANVSPHGGEWQQACSDLGIPGESATHRLSLPTRSLKRNWKYVCLNCDSSIERVRRFKGRVACYECCQKSKTGEYDERFRLIERSIA